MASLNKDNAVPQYVSVDAEWPGFVKLVNARINRHGHGLSQALVRHLQDDQSITDNDWKLVGCDYPVRINDHETSADIVLQSEKYRALIVAECKRVRHNETRFVFLKSVLTSNDDYAKGLRYETAVLYGGKLGEIQSVIDEERSIEKYGWVVPLERKGLKSVADGDDVGMGSTICSDAIGQVLKCLYGILSQMKSTAGLLVKSDKTILRVLPVVITNAELWTCSTPLSAAALESGQFSADESSLVRSPVVVCDCSVSRSVSLAISVEHMKMADAHQFHFVKSVLFVEAQHLNVLLQKLPGWLPAE